MTRSYISDYRDEMNQSSRVAVYCGLDDSSSTAESPRQKQKPLAQRIWKRLERRRRMDEVNLGVEKDRLLASDGDSWSQSDDDDDCLSRMETSHV